MQPKLDGPPADKHGFFEAEYLLGRSMRIALSIAAVLGLLATLWCAAGYFFAPAQAGETRAELRVFLDRPVSADVPEIHSSRVLQQGRNIGIAALLTGASTALMFTALALSRRRRLHEHTTA